MRSSASRSFPNRACSYWPDDRWLGVPKVKNVMPRNRFGKLNQYLHLNNNSNALPREDANYNKLFKVRPLLDVITKQFREVYNPAQNLSIDEAMIAFKGRLSIKQYMPQKPIKRGIKVWCCASSENGFVSGGWLKGWRRRDKPEFSRCQRSYTDIHWEKSSCVL